MYFQTTDRSRFYGTLHAIPRQTVSSHRNSNEHVRRLSMTSLHALTLPHDQCDVNKATTSISNWTQLEFKQQEMEQSKDVVVAVVMGITSRKLLSKSDSRSRCRIRSEVNIKLRVCGRLWFLSMCMLKLQRFRNFGTGFPVAHSRNRNRNRFHFNIFDIL